jgi:ribose transport system ATP-binding protein
MSSENLLELRHVSKTFATTRALVDVRFSVNSGEVHGLLGANGSGKSTILKILSGFVDADAGAELSVHGNRVSLPGNGGDARSHGWGFVHQDLALFPNLRIVDNLHLAGATLGSPAASISWRKEIRAATEILRRFHLELDPSLRVADLPPPKQALVAIARALFEAEMHGTPGDDRFVLFLDESTVSLEANDRRELRAVIDRLVERGSAVVLVSHDLNEVRQLTNQVTVLRDGEVAGAGPTHDFTDAQLLRLVVGDALSTEMAAATGRTAVPAARDRLIMRVRGLNCSSVKDVSFECFAGEILGLTGLAGSGYEDIPYLLFGARTERDHQGAIEIGGRTLQIQDLTPAVAITNGICLVPGSRATQGLISSLPVWQNVTLPSLRRYRGSGRKLLRRKERAAASEVTRKVNVRPPDVSMPVGSLSGGNQQKVVVAKWLNAQPQVLLLHEPTIGIDVGARSQLHQLLRAAASEGMAVICASGDYEQLEVLCQRVLVFRHGTIHAELVEAGVTKRAMAIESLDESND